jgi:signal transduction histidine kinase
MGKNYNVFYPRDVHRKVAEMLRVLLENQSWEGEQLHRRKDGSMISINQTMSLIRDEHDKAIAIMAVGRDITPSKRLEHELRSAKRHSEFYLDILTHDLSNINQGLLSHLELMKRKPKTVDSDNNHIENAIKQLKNGINLIDNVNKLTRIEHDKKDFKNYDLNSVLQYCIKRIKMNYPWKKIRVWGNFDQLKPIACADDFIYEMFSNILDNAVKFDRRKEVEIGINFNKTKRKSIDYLKVSILDQGCGIAPDKKSPIFERYKGTKAKPKGSGFGLTIVRALIDRYNGDVWVEDRVPGDFSKGTVFCVVLPSI